MKKENIHIGKQIAPGGKEVFTERVKAHGTIENFRARFYSGQEKELTVHAYVKKKGTTAPDFFLNYIDGGENFLAGNDDYFEYQVFLEVAYDDEIVVVVTNKNDTYSYDVMVDIAVSYHMREKGAND